MKLDEISKNFSMFIYKTTNKITGKIYIGQKSTPVNLFNYKGSGKLLTQDINVYGKNNFIVEIIEYGILDKEILNEREKFWIMFYNAKNSDIGYNMTDGGMGCENPREEVIISKSEKQKGKITWMKGKKHTEESKQKIRDHHVDNSGEKNYWFGKTFSDETRKLMSENHADFNGEKNPSFNKKYGNTTSKYHGVSLNKDLKKWSSYFNVENKKRIYLGLFPTEIEAAMAYNEAILEYFGYNVGERINIIPQEDIDFIWNILLSKEEILNET